TAGSVHRPSFRVPLSISCGRGFHKRESRFATLLYSVQETPSEARKLLTYMWRASETQLALAREVPLQRFVEEHRRESDERIARRLARTLQIALHREERIVLGRTVLPASTV